MRSVLALGAAFLVLTCSQPPASSAVTPTAVVTASPTPLPTPSPTPTPLPTVETAVSYLKTLSGYEWVVPPAEVSAVVVTAFETPALKEVFSEQPVLRLVTRRGENSSLALVVLPLKSSYAALPSLLESVVQGYSQTKPTELTISGRRALYFKEDAQYNFKSLIWSHRSMVIWMYGYNNVSIEAMSDFASQLITTNQ
jgi:hypothetical protein